MSESIPEESRAGDHSPEEPTAFLFATGIECSYPVIRNGSYRVDELQSTRHYQHWREDLLLTSDLGIRVLRYGVPYYRVNTNPGVYDWSFLDEVLAEMRLLRIEPILDLCHFGMPSWLGNSFQNQEFPQAFAIYARAVAERYPWVRLYTPINEMYVCAKFSAQEGWWNEQEKSERAYVTATRNLAKASRLAMSEIAKVKPDAVFIQSEASEQIHTVCGCAENRKRVDWENQLRFLSLDLLYGHHVRTDVHTCLMDHGMSQEEYRWFMNDGLESRCVMGNDYYAGNERILQHDGSVTNQGEIFGWYLVTRQYYERYRKPIMHTETNNSGSGDAVEWLWKQWQNVLYARAEGIPVLGFTWFSLTDQVDWDTQLREANGTVNAWGLYDLDRKIRPVGEAYRQLIKEFSWLPIVPNGDFFGVT